MCASGKQAKHAGGIGSVEWLGEYQAIDDDDGIGAENRSVRANLADSERFFASQAFGTVFRVLARKRIFRDMRSLNFTRDPGTAQELLTARRGGSKDEHARHSNA